MILGLDSSTHNGRMNYRKAREAGVRFAYSRTTVGDYYTDKHLEENYATARGEGMPWGPYHVVAPECSVKGQLDNLFFALSGKEVHLPIVLDCELHRNQKPAAITAVIWKLATEIERELGTPIIYTAQGFWNRYVLKGNWSRFPLWVANYTLASEPLLPRDWKDYLIWQYSADGNLLGPTYGAESKSIDLNRFNGDEAAFQAFISGASTPPEPTGMVRLQPGYYLRNQPEKVDATIFGVTRENARARVIAESGDWLHVQTWIHKEAVR